MEIHGVYLVTDRGLCGPRGIIPVVEEALKGGARLVQLREKELSTREFVKEALDIRNLLLPYRVPLIINDRVDVALAVGAEGVHLGQSDMPYLMARKLLGPDAIVGISVNSLDQVYEAEKWGPSYIAVSPVFDTATKSDISRPWGLEGLREVRKISRHPVVAIGGISPINARSVVEAGADSLAVVSAICCAASPLAATRELTGAFGGRQP